MCYLDSARKCLTSLLFLIGLTFSNSTGQIFDSPLLNAGAEEQISTAGYYTLHWELPGNPDLDPSPTFEVLEASDPEFSGANVRYRGTDLATTISGQEDGRYYYRVRVVTDPPAADPWSNVHRVVVDHHDLDRALVFLIVGALVFSATSGVILYGHRRERNENSSAAS